MLLICCYCCCCPWCCCCWKRWRLGVGFATDQEYKWIDEYWPFPDSLVLTHSLNCFSYHLYLFLYNEKLYSINYNWLGSNSEILAQTYFYNFFLIFSWTTHWLNCLSFRLFLSLTPSNSSEWETIIYNSIQYRNLSRSIGKCFDIVLLISCLRKRLFNVTENRKCSKTSKMSWCGRYVRQIYLDK